MPRHVSQERLREIRGYVAKLLAKENVTVVHGDFSTAFFDCENRLLGLPRWEVDDQTVYDLLIGHEIGHALHTPGGFAPTVKKKYPKIPFGIFNIVEDIRIERLIQKDYPGLISSFQEGYKNLVERGMFDAHKGKTLDDLGFADRLNIHAKCRHTRKVKMSKEELDIYDRCMEAETAEDVEKLVVEIYERIKEEKEKQKEEEKKQEEEQREDPPKSSKKSRDKSPQEPSDADSQSGDGDGKSEEGDGEDRDGDPTGSGGEDSEDGDNSSPGGKPNDSSGESEEGDGEDRDEEMTSGIGSPSLDSAEDELRSETMEQAERMFDQMKSPSTGMTPFVPPTSEEAMKHVIPWKRVMESRKRKHPEFAADRAEIKKWNDFRKEINKEIRHLTNEFERRKAAWQYSRATVSQTGTLDVNSLHKYKYDDHIFKSVTRLADAKSHGMVFMIDYSSSMDSILGTILRHTIRLVMFCRAVGIPHEVYGFTTPSAFSYEMTTKTPLKVNLGSCRMFELLSSEMDRVTYDLALRHIFSGVGGHRYAKWGEYENLGGTPLYEAMIISHHILDSFIRRSGVQKPIFISLTDGDGGGISFGNGPMKNMTSGGVPTTNREGFFYGKKKIRLSPQNPSQLYTALAENMGDSLGVRTIGFFIGHTGCLEGKISEAVNASVDHSKQGSGTASMAMSNKLKSDLNLKGIAHARHRTAYKFDDYFFITMDEARGAKVEKSTYSLSQSSSVDSSLVALSLKKKSMFLLTKFAEAIA